MGNVNRKYFTKNIIKRKALIIVMISILCSLVCFMLAIKNLELSYQAVFFIVTMGYIWILKTWNGFYKSYLDPYSVFVVTTYVFYYGQYLLYVIGVPLNSGKTIVNTYSQGNYNYVSLFILTAMLLVHIGALCGILFSKNPYLVVPVDKIKEEEKNIKADFKALKIIAVFLLIISYIPTLIILFNYIKIVFSVGYGSVFKSELYTSGGFNNILGFLSTFIIPALVSGIIAFKNSKYLNFMYILTAIYITLYFLSGSRNNAVSVLFAILLIKKYFIGGINFCSKVKLFIVCPIFITILSLISTIRSELCKSASYGVLVINVLKEMMEENIIFTFLREFGYTLVATTTVFIYCPEPVEHVYGETYFASLLKIFPNIFWSVHPASKVSVDSVFKSFITSNGGIGSSFIAEAYYNFGCFSLFAMPVIGYLLYKLFAEMNMASKMDKIGVGFLTIYIFSFILFYIRSDTTSFWRNLIYYGFMPYLMFGLIRNSIKRRISFDECN